ncbi:MAG: MarR family transcriptional regulator, partial [Chloroflexi bacterium]|nr:MarR family transcriptional regulator [Chloroflexota bacterium]
MSESRWTAEQIQAWAVFLYAHSSVLRTLERELQDRHGLLLTWYEVLIMLEHAPGNRLTHGELGEGVVLTRSGITRVVDRMVKEGLVAREQSSEDRRQSYVVMIPGGRKALDEAGPDHVQRVHELFSGHLLPEEAPAVLAFFTRVLGDEESEKAMNRAR